MGASEVRHLTYNDFFNAIKDEIGLRDSEMFNFQVINEKLKSKKDAVGTWKINRYKTNIPYITFNSPESNKAIIKYILDRDRNNKTLKIRIDVFFRINDVSNIVFFLDFLYCFLYSGLIGMD